MFFKDVIYDSVGTLFFPYHIRQLKLHAVNVS